MAIGIDLNSDDPPLRGGSMFGLRPGTWTLSSKTDPRFNMSGRALVGGFQCPQEAEDAMEAKARELGEPVPKDLMFSYMKD